MFGASVIFLACLATLVVIWVDVPNLSERTIETLGEGDEEQALIAGQLLNSSWLAKTVAGLMLVLWILFAMEALFFWIARPWTRQFLGSHLRHLLICVVPPLRLCARNRELENAMWFPGIGWRKSDEHLRMQLQRYFSMPMLGIAILILPVLGIEFFLSKQVAEHSLLRFGLHFSTGLIWFAFTCEFLVMISVAENRIDYCKKHWLDLAIILLPLISFLRSLQIVRATRLAKITKVQQLSKMARVYRLRGVSTRALRALLLLEVAEKLLRPKPAKHLVKLRAEHRRLTRQLHQLESLIHEVEAAAKAEKQKAEKSKDKKSATT